MNLSFCVQCSAPLIQKNPTDYVCESGHPYWNNPSATVAVILLKNGQVLYAKRAREPRKDMLDLPGGFLNYNEDAAQGARREIKEETGLDLLDLQPFAVVTHEYQTNISVCDILFVSDTFTGDLRPADDVSELEWKSPEFMNSDGFAWDYPDLMQKLGKYLEES